jgi:hypothetical protein
MDKQKEKKMQKKVPKLQMEDVLWLRNKKGDMYMQHCKKYLKWAHFDGGHWVVEIECQQQANVLPTFVAIKIVMVKLNRHEFHRNENMCATLEKPSMIVTSMEHVA